MMKTACLLRFSEDIYGRDEKLKTALEKS